MLERLTARVSRELGLTLYQVERTMQLLDDDNTIPFIARYRKEMTGGLDEVQIGNIAARSVALRALETRRDDVRRLISEQGKLTPEIEIALHAASSLQELEDLYLPFRPKRRTRAMIARERGLEPLADAILAQVSQQRQALALTFVDPTKDVPGAEDALAGARDIVAEIVVEDADVRSDLREYFSTSSVVTARLLDPSKDEQRTYEHYYAFQETLAALPPHRILALNRAERDGALRVGVEVDGGTANAIVARYYAADDRSPFAGDLRKAIADSFERMLAPALEREMRTALSERAERHAIGVFALNLRPLLLQPPLRGRTVIGIDPGYRSGCKIAVVSETGQLLAGTTVYPHAPQKRWAEASTTLKDLVRSYKASVFAIGNGTAGRETETLAVEIIQELGGTGLSYVMVDEAGASVYSVSEIAREEFPDLEATQRGVVSIARRLQDPLAELVKVDPQSVGVGLYQHDVDQKELAAALDQVVVSAVTFAGVDVNTASTQLLSRVAGLNKKSAAAIVHYREQHGKFASRRELLKVPGIGPRSFEQAAGFLRVTDGDDILDRTFIHPESYAACRRLIQQFPVASSSDSLPVRASRFARGLEEQAGSLEALAVSLGIGEPTLRDMLGDLARPGLDPREDSPPPLLRTSAISIEELHEGMIVQGTIRNVVDFGAFVDIGLKQAGLVHISELADRFVTSPHEVVQVGQRVQVRVKSVEPERGRVGLSMRLGRG